jgi:hypothetical protein
MQTCDHWSADPLRLYIEPLRPSITPQLQNFYFDADPDPNFHSDANPKTTSQNDANPGTASQDDADPRPQHWFHFIVRCFGICPE